MLDGNCHGLPRQVSYIFVSILVDCHVNGAKRAPPDLLIDYVLVDAMLGCAIVFAVAVFGARVQRLLRCGNVRVDGGAGH